uniref:Initiator protein NS1 n=1 Tax=Bat parvovirus TaxID=1514704 RepID=A0A894JI94_9VIRU|nr:NS1 [Bat parvovirus]QRV11698.1 NS1 [Bat parvovirus]
MTAVPELSEAAEAAEAWLVSHEDAPALSYVFKIKDTEINGKKITWRSFTTPPRDEDFRYLYQGHLVDLERQGGEGSSTATGLPSETSCVAAMVAACAKSSLYTCFKARGIDPKDIIWFCQVEIGPLTGLHVHLLVGGKGFGPANGKWILRLLQSEFAKWLAACCSVHLTPAERIAFRDHVVPNHYVTLLKYKHKSTKKEYTKVVDFGQMVMMYFFNKEPYAANQDRCYVISWDNMLLTTDLSFSERKAIHNRTIIRVHGDRSSKKRDGASKSKEEPDQVDSVEPAKKKKRTVTQREINTKEIVDKLTEKRIVTLEDWMLLQPDTYIQALTSPGGQNYCINILEISGLRVSKDCTAYGLIVEQGEDKMRLVQSKIWKIFEKNCMNPLKCMHAIACVLNKQSGKRNSILFHGPATTGKSLLAQSIAREVRNTGCYNPANVNFPFNDCLNKNLIWVEEAGNFGQQVNQFKAVMSGQDIRVDQKGKGSKPLNSTPVVMTSNEDVTQVRVGCELRPEHTQPIRDRLVEFNLQIPLGGDFGLIDAGEFGRFFRTMEELGYQPTMANYLSWWGRLPVYGENWSDPAIKDPQSEQELDKELSCLLDAFVVDSQQGPSFDAELQTPVLSPTAPSSVSSLSLEAPERPTPAEPISFADLFNQSTSSLLEPQKEVSRHA